MLPPLLGLGSGRSTQGGAVRASSQPVRLSAGQVAGREFPRGNSRVESKGCVEVNKLSRMAVVAASALGLAGAVTGCSRDKIEAVKLMNEADGLRSTSADSAISKYEAASRLDGTNPLILWKLSQTYFAKEEWEKAASVLARGTTLAPTNADFWFNRGYALSRQAEKNRSRDLYEEAKEPYKKCIEADPNYAECYHWLGEAYEWTDEPQRALELYTQALEKNPKEGYFYPALAEAYYTLKKFSEAEKVYQEGLRVVPQTEDNQERFFEMYAQLAKAQKAQGNTSQQVELLEKAQKFGGKTHPESSFYLATAYLSAGDKAKALTQLGHFQKSGCKGARAKNFQELCAQAGELSTQLGGGGAAQ